MHWKSTLLKPYFPLALLSIFCLPILYIAQMHTHKMSELETLQQEFEQLKPKIKKALVNSNHTQEFLQAYKDTDHLYLEKHLEALKFQTEKLQYIKSLQHMSSFASSPDIKKQLQRCGHKNNSIALKETSNRVNKYVQETELKLMHPIYVGTEDLYAILSMVEQANIPAYKAPPGAPQMFFKSFQLKRVKQDDDQEVYQLNFELIKREPLKK